MPECPLALMQDLPKESPFLQAGMQSANSTDSQPSCLPVPTSSGHTQATFSNASLQQMLDAQVRSSPAF